MEKGFKLYEKKQIPLLVGVLGALVAALMFGYWIMPMWDTVRNSILENEKTVSELKARNDELDAVEKFKVYLAKEGDKVKLMNDVLPDSEAVDDLLIQIERLAIDNTLFVRNINVTEEKTTESDIVPGLNQVKVMMQLDGEFPNMLHFIDNLQNSTRLVMINKLNIASNITSEDTPVSYTVEMNLFYLQDK